MLGMVVHAEQVPNIPTTVPVREHVSGEGYTSAGDVVHSDRRA